MLQRTSGKVQLERQQKTCLKIICIKLNIIRKFFCRECTIAEAAKKVLEKMKEKLHNFQ